MTWDLHAAGLDVMGDGDVADAVARVSQERRARVEVVGDGIRVVASHPAVDDVPWSGGGFGRVVCVVDVGEPSCDGQ